MSAATRLAWWGYCSAHRLAFGGTIGASCPECDAGLPPWWPGIPRPGVGEVSS